MKSLKERIDWKGDLEKQLSQIRAQMNKEVREKCYEILARKHKRKDDPR